MLKGLGLITLNDQFGSGGDGVLRHAVADQRIRAASLETPVGHRAVGGLLVTPEPGMRVDQFHFRDHTVHHHGLRGVKGRCKGMMSLHRHCGHHQS